MMLNRILLIFTLLVGLAQQSFCQSNGDKIFSEDKIHVLHFYSETEPDLYETLQGEADLNNDRPYHPVRMIFDEEEIDSVGLRVKGFSSSFSPQVPFKIDINEYISSQTFDGLKKFGLTNSFFDSYRQKDRISYELFRRAGVPAPRTSYVEVYINDVFINIYLLVQQIDKIFIKDHFPDEGSLIKFGSIQGELIYGQNDFAPVLGIDNLERLNNVNLRTYFKFLLINKIVSASDNYPDNNFYIYQSEKEDLFHFLPWDYNLSMLSILGTGDILPPNDLISISNDPELQALYWEVACELHHYLLDESYIEDFIQHNYETILSNTQGENVISPEVLIDFFCTKKLGNTFSCHGRRI